MSKIEPCGLCGRPAVVMLTLPDGTVAAQCSAAGCLMRGPTADESGAKWNTLQRWLRLGRKLDAAIERGRTLHPWRGSGKQLRAMVDEVDELMHEVPEKLSNGHHQVERIRDEALDVYVCAQRLVDGR